AGAVSTRPTRARACAYTCCGRLAGGSDTRRRSAGVNLTPATRVCAAATTLTVAIARWEPLPARISRNAARLTSPASASATIARPIIRRRFINIKSLLAPGALTFLTVQQHRRRDSQPERYRKGGGDHPRRAQPMRRIRAP